MQRDQKENKWEFYQEQVNPCFMGEKLSPTLRWRGAPFPNDDNITLLPRWGFWINSIPFIFIQNTV